MGCGRMEHTISDPRPAHQHYKVFQVSLHVRCHEHRELVQEHDLYWIARCSKPKRVSFDLNMRIAMYILKKKIGLGDAKQEPLLLKATYACEVSERQVLTCTMCYSMLFLIFKDFQNSSFLV